MRNVCTPACCSGQSRARAGCVLHPCLWLCLCLWLWLQDLSAEVAARMAEAGVRGRLITLKLKVRQEGAPAPAKFLGHGHCDNVSRSVTLGSFTSAAQVRPRPGDHTHMHACTRGQAPIMT